MKKPICLTTLAALCFGAAPLCAQVVVEPANGNVAAPAPATPVAPTPGGERRAVRREDRRIDRNDPTGTLAPTVNPNGTVTATPNVAAPAIGVQGGPSPAVVAPGPAVGPNVNAVPGPGVGVNAAPVAPETWRYRYQNGQWLYYTPQNNWMIYNGNAWNAYTANANLSPPVAPNQQTVVTSAPAVRTYSYPPNNGYYRNGYYYDSYNDAYYRRGLFGRRRY